VELFLEFYKNICKSINESLDNKKFLIGCSGGPDSVCLLFMFNELKKKITIDLRIAHVNYNLRGKDSLLDMKLVEKYAMMLNIPIHIKNISHEKGNIQQWARNERYNFFNQIKKEYNLDYIALAHNLEDQTETMLINLIRGTGPQGIIGMKIKEKDIIRPLLNISRNNILKFLQDNKIEYRIDKTNNQTKYTRNKIRHIILPILQEINKDALQHFYKASILQNNILENIKTFFNTIFKEAVITNNNYILKLKLPPLMKIPNNLLSDFFIFLLKKFCNSISDYSSDQIQETVTLFIQKISFEKDFKRKFYIYKNKHFLILAKKIKKSELQINDYSNNINFLNKEIFISTIKNNIDMKSLKITKNKILLDYSKIQFPLIISNNHKIKLKLLNSNILKNVNDILKDKGYTKFERKLIFNIRNSNGDCLCIENGIINDDYKVINNTKQILSIEIKELK